MRAEAMAMLTGYANWSLENFNLVPQLSRPSLPLNGLCPFVYELLPRRKTLRPFLLTLGSVKSHTTDVHLFYLTSSGCRSQRKVSKLAKGFGIK